MTKEEYHEYLKTPKWKRKREMALARDKRQCVFCHKTTNLNIHHLSYENVEHETPENLLTLCEDCHHKLHEKIEEYKKYANEERIKAETRYSKTKLSRETEEELNDIGYAVTMDFQHKCEELCNDLCEEIIGENTGDWLQGLMTFCKNEIGMKKPIIYKRPFYRTDNFDVQTNTNNALMDYKEPKKEEPQAKKEGTIKVDPTMLFGAPGFTIDLKRFIPCLCTDDGSSFGEFLRAEKAGKMMNLDEYVEHPLKFTENNTDDWKPFNFVTEIAQKIGDMMTKCTLQSCKAIYMGDMIVFLPKFMNDIKVLEHNKEEIGRAFVNCGIAYKTVEVRYLDSRYVTEEG